MDLVVRSPDELLAALPHVFGFNPAESVVLVPLTRGLPAARVDLPTTGGDREVVRETMSGTYQRHARRGAEVALICVTENRRQAELASDHLADGLERAGVSVPLRFWATEDRWTDFSTGQSGSRTPEVSSRIGAEMVAAGRARPAASRESLAASLVGDRRGVAAELPPARRAATSGTLPAERDWAVSRLERFHQDGNRLTDADAARLLLAIDSISCRDVLWEDMTRENATAHTALWSDLTRRAPDEVRAPAAALLAFSSWLDGDGAGAWCALDQVPAEQQPYALAGLVASALQNGVHPEVWNELRADLAESEAYVPRPAPDHRAHGLPQGVDAPDRRPPVR